MDRLKLSEVEYIEDVKIPWTYWIEPQPVWPLTELMRNSSQESLGGRFFKEVSF